ncbi:hypothetical protein [Amycolatopsis taiwanensis]|uniref:Uncharacterized protein n=1 Tax=Amycolatopsis taiwanensis TaxID=342230 RepID=A0A9W6VFJ7_9PSEU|nr:hypothetical protein [Amycolatopsis taiwanensis]GLY69683.1 hypothetical protein Atai01_63020 [Amycolatopsis taiwanensis]
MRTTGARETNRRTVLRGGLVLAAGTALAATGTASASAQSAQSAGPEPVRRRLPFLLDMVHNNPGEPSFSSRFNDPATLAAYGYDGQVINEFKPPQTAITFDSFDPRIFPAGSPGRAWVEAAAQSIDAHIARAHAAGIAAYIFTDIIVLPKRLVELYGDQILDDKGNISFDRPLTQEIHRVMLREVFARFPGLDGIVVRTGETYLQNVPFHTGNNPITSGATSHHILLGILREEVCVRAGKRVFYRTWSTGGDKLTADPAYYQQVTEEIETHENLVFSIKHTAKDFWRTVGFNQTIGVGRHRQIVEVECQREYEGKGAFPNYVFDGVVNGFEEFRTQPRTGPIGLADVIGNPIVAGIWTWSRGGGWRGPYLQNELWCDLNAWVTARWARDTGLGEEGAFNAYAARIGLHGDQVRRFRRLALLSAAGVLRGHYSLVYPLGRLTWTRDQFLGGSDKDLAGDFAGIVDRGLVDAVLEEKQQAARIWDEIVALAGTLPLRDHADREFLRVSARYGQSWHRVVHHGWEVMLRGVAGDKSGSYDKPAMRHHLAQYDAEWDNWRRLVADEPSSATLYQPYSFGSKNADGLYDADPDHGMKPATDHYRALLSS